MARWRLTQPHYLKAIRDGEKTEWRYEETNRDTGRTARKVFEVPLFLNPNDPADHNYRELGAVIVAQGKVQPRDIIFEGPPTPDMEPLDDEAQAISDAEAVNWQHPIESLPGNYSASLLTGLERQLAALIAERPIQPVSVKGVDPSEFEALKDTVQKLMDQNAVLQAQLAEQPPKVERRV